MTGRKQKAARPKAPSANVAAVLSHPLRCRILVVLNATVSSPNELAAEFGLELTDVSYHIRKLLSVDAIELVRERQVRGAVEHFYRATRHAAATPEEYAELDDAARRAFNATFLQLFLADASTALDSGTMTARPDHWATRIPGEVDKAGWSELSALFEETEQRALDVLGRSRNRVAESGEETIPVVGVLTFFELPGATRNAMASLRRRD